MTEQFFQYQQKCQDLWNSDSLMKIYSSLQNNIDSTEIIIKDHSICRNQKLTKSRNQKIISQAYQSLNKLIPKVGQKNYQNPSDQFIINDLFQQTSQSDQIRSVYHKVDLIQQYQGQKKRSIGIKEFAIKLDQKKSNYTKKSSKKQKKLQKIQYKTKQKQAKTIIIEDLIPQLCRADLKQWIHSTAMQLMMQLYVCFDDCGHKYGVNFSQDVRKYLNQKPATTKWAKRDQYHPAVTQHQLQLRIRSSNFLRYLQNQKHSNAFNISLIVKQLIRIFQQMAWPLPHQVMPEFAEILVRILDITFLNRKSPFKMQKQLKNFGYKVANGSDQAYNFCFFSFQFQISLAQKENNKHIKSKLKKLVPNSMNFTKQNGPYEQFVCKIGDHILPYITWILNQGFERPQK